MIQDYRSDRDFNDILECLEEDLSLLHRLIFNPNSPHYIKSKLCDAERRLEESVGYLKEYLT